MGRSQIISAVKELESLEAEEAEAERVAAPRRARIAELCGFLDGLSAEPPGAKDSATPADLVTMVLRRRKREARRQDQVRALILSRPGIGYRGLCEAIYGAYDQKIVLNMRSLVSNMKAANQLAGEPGKWRVILSETDGADAPVETLSGKHIADDHGSSAA